MVFLLLSAFSPTAGLRVRAAAALAGSYLVEISQLYQAHWMTRLRDSPLIHLVLGSRFSWTDIAAYTAGVALAATLNPVDGRVRPFHR